MVERQPWLSRLSNLFLALAIAFLVYPVYYALLASTLTLEQVNQTPVPSSPAHLFTGLGQLWLNVSRAWTKSNLGTLLLNSFIVASLITLGKIVISILSAFAIVYFRFPFRKTSFWLIFVTLMLPVEVRILPTYEVVANLRLLDTYTGLTLPLMASATATFLFRQFFLSVPDELFEAARVDGASPWQFFTRVLLPLSKTNIAALVVITFVYGWNQFLWPLLMTTQKSMRTAVIGIQELIPVADQAPEWNVALAGTLVVMLPPIALVILMQRFFVKGLVENEK
jgi:sn-glycerol 3-phosphate transport system permease protein